METDCGRLESHSEKLGEFLRTEGPSSTFEEGSHVIIAVFQEEKSSGTVLLGRL